MLKCVNAAFIVLKVQFSTSKLKVNGEKAPKERHIQREYYSVTTRLSLRASANFKNSLFRIRIRAECNKYANCCFHVLLITCPLCVKRGHDAVERKRRTGGWNVHLLIIPYIIKPFTLPVIESDSLTQHCKRPQIHSLIEHIVITVKLSSVATWTQWRPYRANDLKPGQYHKGHLESTA